MDGTGILFLAKQFATGSHLECLNLDLIQVYDVDAMGKDGRRVWGGSGFKGRFCRVRNFRGKKKNRILRWIVS